MNYFLLVSGGKAYFDDVTSPVASPSNSKDEHDVDPKVNTEEMQNSLQSTLSDSAAAVGITPLVVSEDDASKALGAPMTDITVGTDHLQLPPSIAPQSAACSHNGSLTLDSHLEHAFDAKDHVSDVASDKGSFLGPVGNKRSGAGISQGMRAYSSKTVILAPTVGGPSMPTHSKLGGWKVNSVGRHSDHNRERISSAVCAKNMSRANSASAPQLRASTSPPKVKNSTVRTLKVDVGTAEDSRSGADSIPKTPPLVVNMLDVGLNSGDSPTAGDPGNQLHSYERTSCLSHASTDVDALQKEFVDHLSNSLVEAKDMPSYVVPKESADSVTDSPLSSCRDTSSDKKNHSTKRVVTIATSVTNLTGSGELEPYMVHSRIMGWKLTSLSRRKKLMTMLDKIQEIPTEDMIELSYSQSEGLIAPTEKSASTLNKSASTKECELNDTKTEVNDSLYANDYAASAVLNTYSRIWTDSETKVATLRASNSRSKSRREIEAWETSVTRQLKAFESTPLGRAEKIRRLTALARKPNGKGSADAMSVAREKEVTQKMLLKTRDENIEKVRKMHGPSELHLSLLRERDRMVVFVFSFVYILSPL